MEWIPTNCASQMPEIFNKICPVAEPVELSIVMPCLNEAETLAPHRGGAGSPRLPLW